MRLRNLKKYDYIVIQMHDNPDADAVGSGYALYVYFQSLGKNVRLIYGGKTKITKSNICMLIKELETAAIAMIRFSYDAHKRLSIVKAKPCDPNILGLVGDMVLQVDSIDVCIIFNECDGGYKLSVRSCQAEVTANELAAYLTAGIGNGGGHTDKAGGFINQKKYEEKYEDTVIESYIFNRVEQYYDSFDVIYAKDGIADKTGFVPCKKKPYTYGYVRTTDLYEAGTECRVRTYEGDLLVTARDDIYLMIGFFGEVYPIEKEYFDKTYTPLDEKLVKKFDYAPSVRSLRQDMTYELMPWARQCLSRGSEVYARLLEKPTKVFSKWNYETYMYGAEGDYICYSYEDEKDICIVKKEVFEEIYEIV